MTKKDYVKIAHILKVNKPNHTNPDPRSNEEVTNNFKTRRQWFDMEVDSFCYLLYLDNPQFDEDKFRKAVYN